MPDQAKDRITAHQCEVVGVGEAVTCEDEDCPREHFGLGDFHSCPAEVGDWLIVRPRCFLDSPEPEKKEWLIRQDDALAIVRE